MSDVTARTGGRRSGPTAQRRTSAVPSWHPVGQDEEQTPATDAAPIPSAPTVPATSVSGVPAPAPPVPAAPVTAPSDDALPASPPAQAALPVAPPTSLAPRRNLGIWLVLGAVLLATGVALFFGARPGALVLAAASAVAGLCRALIPGPGPAGITIRSRGLDVVAFGALAVAVAFLALTAPNI